jgi:Ca-activated chloride channel family protein
VKRAFHIAIVVLGTVLVTLVALVYPLAAREEVLHATWRHFWFLLLLPVGFVIAWFATYGSDDRTPRMRMPSILPMLAGPRGWRTRIRHVPGFVRGAAIVLGVFALARPIVPLSAEKSEERGIDIVLVLDLSGSMRAVMDAPAGTPTKKQQQPKSNLRPTRLDTAKDVIEDFVSRRKSDRIGVVVFGKAAYVLSPPTLDYQLLSQLVSKMELDLIDGNGTAIGDAVGTGVARLRRSNARSKAIVLLTDGDSNAGSIAPEYATHLAKREGVRVYTVQIGNGDVVDVFAGVDWLGQPVYEKQVFPVNPTLLKKMSLETDGDSFVATDRAGLEQSMHSILDKLEKTKLTASTAQSEELFPYFLAPAVVLVALEALLRVLLLRRFP